ncbi:TPA: UvrD-helicase domain-containing protein [Vibrio parahaemolyticus]
MSKVYPFTEGEIQQVCTDLGIPKDAFSEKISERRIVIDNWSNINVVACPGSGKSTVLLAKLLLMSKRMPFEDGKGICVLTHTNVAIDEIKSKLGGKAGVLFNYPNYFGTIQSFVGKFLLKKAFFTKFGVKVDTVDTVLHEKKILAKFRSLDRFNHPLHKKLFMMSYEPKITINDIKDFCFKDDVDVKGVKPTKQQKSKSIHDELKKLKIIDSKGNMIYFNCKSICKDAIPNSYGKRELLERLISDKHSLAMSDINTNKERKLLNLWLDFKDEKLFISDSGKKLVAGKDTETYKHYHCLKTEVLKEGVVSYRDAFDISRLFCNENSLISDVISSRFGLLFLDEAQDTQSYQMDILEHFNDSVIKQYFGDPDQSIFNNISHGKSAWNINKDGFEKLTISDSKRFSRVISDSLDPFKINLQEIKGKASWESIKPHLILYAEPKSILDKFCDLILEYNLNNFDEYVNNKDDKSLFHAVGFVGLHDNKNESLSVRSYYPDYNKHSGSKRSHKNLISYFSTKDHRLLKISGTDIYFSDFKKALLKTLNVSGYKLSHHELFGEGSTHSEVVDALRNNSLPWILELSKGSKSPSDVKNEFIHMVTSAGYSVSDSEFINDDHMEVIDCIDQKNVFSRQGINVKVGTIHSVKGESHLATLVLETSNYEKTESDYFFNDKSGKLFCGDDYKQPKCFSRLEQRMQILYVGISRPKRLLCVALDKSKVDCLQCAKKNTDDCTWKVIELN